jgi:hypothetical protein
MRDVSVRHRLVALGIVVVLGVPAFGVGIGAVRADPVDASTVCDRLTRRASEVPGIRGRIRDQIEAIERRLERIGDARRRGRVRARLAPRLAGLETLDTRLAEQVAQARQRCASSTT